ncbi:uncharacterized protein LOC117321896 [Pecten maximus]|uniref:uncharacterized protein LOC117321896 n=1 Tax=Pecten maximus TaxID=6579 RepID=UPI001458AE06|nr:uncharacterized protein LOC117321896 [Pecten maximus]
MVTEGGRKEDRLTFVDDGDYSDHFSADKSTYRSDIEPTEVCFGDRSLNQHDKVMLQVTRSEPNGVCEIAVLSEEHFSRLTSTNNSFRYRKLLKSFPNVLLRSNILRDPMTRQIVVTVPMAKSGRPVFIFSGCTLDLRSDISSRGVGEVTTLKEIDETTNKEEEPLCQVQRTLATLEMKWNQKEKDDQEHQRKLMDQMKASRSETELQSASLVELRERQVDILKNVEVTRGTVENTSGMVKRISSRLNNRLIVTKGTNDKSLELLSKYINPNFQRIKKALDENEFMDYLRQYEVLTGDQHEEIRSRESSERRRQKLLDILCKKPVSKLPNVRKALQESGNGDLLQYFKECEN